MVNWELGIGNWERVDFGFGISDLGFDNGKQESENSGLWIAHTDPAGRSLFTVDCLLFTETAVGGR